MDRVTQYRQIVQDFLKNFAADDPETQLIFDVERVGTASPQENRYLVVHNGWRGNYRICGCATQLDLIEGKVWIQHNSTEVFINQELIQRGVALQDIVFGFRAPSIRERLAAALQEGKK